MTPSRMLRPVLVCLALSGGGLATASCGAMDDANRFESMADSVARISLDDSDGQPQVRTAAEEGLRPATPHAPDDDALKVEVMDPHDLWDARDGMRGAFAEAAASAGPRIAEAASPVVARAVVQQVSARVEAEAPALRPAIARDPAPAPSRTTIQLGAYSSSAAARSAWTQVSKGAARTALNGLSPVYEVVEVNGRPLTRLKVSAPAATAVAICRAAQITDPWCARRT